MKYITRSQLYNNNNNLKSTLKINVNDWFSNQFKKNIKIKNYFKFNSDYKQNIKLNNKNKNKKIFKNYFKFNSYDEQKQKINLNINNKNIIENIKKLYSKRLDYKEDISIRSFKFIILSNKITSLKLKKKLNTIIEKHNVNLAVQKLLITSLKSKKKSIYKIIKLNNKYINLNNKIFIYRFKNILLRNQSWKKRIFHVKKHPFKIINKKFIKFKNKQFIIIKKNYLEDKETKILRDLLEKLKINKRNYLTEKRLNVLIQKRKKRVLCLKFNKRWSKIHKIKGIYRFEKSFLNLIYKRKKLNLKQKSSFKFMKKINRGNLFKWRIRRRKKFYFFKFKKYKKIKLIKKYKKKKFLNLNKFYFNKFYFFNEKTKFTKIKNNFSFLYFNKFTKQQKLPKKKQQKLTKNKKSFFLLKIIKFKKFKKGVIKPNIKYIKFNFWEKRKTHKYSYGKWSKLKKWLPKRVWLKRRFLLKKKKKNF